MINSINDAFKIIKNYSNGIPFDAIRYLRDNSPSDEILEEIIFSLNHAYGDFYYDIKNKVWIEAPLWLAIVAELNLSEKLIDPVINLLTTSLNDADFLNEQGMFLIGKLAQKYPDIVVEKVVYAIDRFIEAKSSIAYLFLFEAFYFCNIEKYKLWLLTTFQKDFPWKDSLASTIAELGIKEAIPIIKDMIAREEDEIMVRELESCLDIFKEGSANGAYCLKRGDWEEHYKGLEKYFLAEDNRFDLANIDIGRNDPCPCGSGKKYKKCCLGRL